MRGAVTRPKNITGTGIGPKKTSNKTKNITGTGIRPKNITGTGIRPKNIIIAFGDNNLRPKGLKSGVSVNDVIRWHQNVVQLVTSIEITKLRPSFYIQLSKSECYYWSTVILVGLLPCLCYVAWPKSEI
jgi:hypothetical protein